MTAFIKSPLALTAVVLMGGAAFAGIMMTAYSGDDADSVPIVKAELGEYKVKPSDEGGMSVPYADSTVFDSMRSAEAGERVENLLAPMQDDLETVEGESEVARISGSSISDMDVSDEVIDITESLQKQAEGQDVNDNAQVAAAESSSDTAVKTESGAENLLARVKPEGKPVSGKAEVDVAAAGSANSAGKNIRPAGSSPETLAYVRSVLDQKDSKVSGATKAPAAEATASVAETMNGVEPAAGAAGMASGYQGTHFVQLASVKDASAAEREWPKLQGKYTVLNGAAHRVEAADLGERGTFYRIQAGPFSESKADSICDAIKVQKPGGCLVVRK